MSIQADINATINRHPKWRAIIDGDDTQYRDLADLMVVVREQLVSVVNAKRGGDEPIVVGTLLSVLVEQDSPNGDGEDCISLAVQTERGEVGITLEPEDGVWEEDADGFETRRAVLWNGAEAIERRPSERLLDWMFDDLTP